MAYEYQTGEDPIDLSHIKELLPSELSGKYFENLDAAMQRSDKLQLDRTLGGLSDHGFLRSGDAFTQVSNNVLGPAQDRRNQVLLPELQRSSDQGREERLQGVAYDRQKDFASIQHKYKLEELDKQAQMQKMLAELEASLNNQDFGLEGILGQVAGNAAGSFTGAAGAYGARSLFGGGR